MLQIIREAALWGVAAVVGHRLPTDRVQLNLSWEECMTLLDALGKRQLRNVAAVVRTIRKQVGLSGDDLLALLAPRSRRLGKHEEIIDAAVEVLDGNPPLPPRVITALAECLQPARHYKIEEVTSALCSEVRKLDARLVRVGRARYALSPAERERRG